jgi:hypothetical protein
LYPVVRYSQREPSVKADHLALHDRPVPVDVAHLEVAADAGLDAAGRADVPGLLDPAALPAVEGDPVLRAQSAAAAVADVCEPRVPLRRRPSNADR